MLLIMLPCLVYFSPELPCKKHVFKSICSSSLSVLLHASFWVSLVEDCPTGSRWNPGEKVRSPLSLDPTQFTSSISVLVSVFPPALPMTTRAYHGQPFPQPSHSPGLASPTDFPVHLTVYIFSCPGPQSGSLYPRAMFVASIFFSKCLVEVSI